MMRSKEGWTEEGIRLPSSWACGTIQNLPKLVSLKEKLMTLKQEQVTSDLPTVDEVKLRSNLLIAARTGIVDNP